MGKTAWRSEPTDVEKSGDELWLGVKCQSNSELAGSPRNCLRASVGCILPGVEHWFGAGCKSRYQIRVKLRIPVVLSPGSETARDKFRRQEGNSPDHRLRSRSYS